MSVGRHTLLLRLVGPMQAWGTDSRFGLRDTDGEPSRSGVTGLLCAALGWDRDAPTHEVAGRTLTLEDMATWRFGVRVVQEGVRVRDFHTAGKAPEPGRAGFLRASGAVEKSDVIVTERFYLSDAAFIIGFEAADRAVLEAVLGALEQPVWPLSLGRKACLPALPLGMDVVDAPLAEALLHAADPGYGRLYGPRRLSEKEAPAPLPGGRILLDADAPAVSLLAACYTLVREVRRADVPRSFRPRHFDARQVRVYMPPASSTSAPAVP